MGPDPNKPLWPAADATPLKRKVYYNADEKTGKLLPIRSKLAKEFPLISRRERRAIIRQAAKDARRRA